MPSPVIPDILKNSNWQSSKGGVAKLAGETGVGAAMSALDAAYKKVDQAAISPLSQYKTIADLDLAEKAAQAELPKLGAISTAAYKLRDVAKATADKYKKNPLIPKAAGEHALAVSKAADQYGVATKSYDPSAGFEQARKNVTAKRQIGIDKLKKYTTMLGPGISALKGKADPTFAEWEKFWTQSLRGINAAIAEVPETKAQSPNWTPLTKDSFKGADLSAEEIKKRVLIVEATFNKLKAVMPAQ